MPGNYINWGKGSDTYTLYQKKKKLIFIILEMTDNISNLYLLETWFLCEKLLSWLHKKIKNTQIKNHVAIMFIDIYKYRYAKNNI